MAMKTGRNQPCPCGSGKKHKRCCWEATAYPDTEARKRADEERRAQRAQKDEELRQRLAAMTPEQLAELDREVERRRLRRLDLLEKMLMMPMLLHAPRPR